MAPKNVWAANTHQMWQLKQSAGRAEERPLCPQSVVRMMPHECDTQI